MARLDRLYNPLWSLWVFISALEWSVTGSDSKTPSEKHVDLGKEYLARGNFQDALEEFHRAIDGDPENFMTYYRRATVYLALGKAKAALSDLNKVIELKPDFTAARIQRGNVFLKQGNLEAARSDFEAVLRVNPSLEEARIQMESLHGIGRKKEDALMAFEDHEYPLTIDLVSDLLENHCSWDVSLRELRGQAHLAMGDMPQAISDFK
ncbi:unnamed protein product [Cyprideis torosa]|uniref:Uncharacterized protein n=1 Tax=Cyprideis torosa TaxID=163714 RepID=A0A7R8ZRQ0_9CRUS|nr:unnamed protein product [Cyprideis torosa]CAG0905278.1 unnamed protein product [Cyprideis torosa]